MKKLPEKHTALAPWCIACRTNCRSCQKITFSGKQQRWRHDETPAEQEPVLLKKFNSLAVKRPELVAKSPALAKKLAFLPAK